MKALYTVALFILISNPAFAIEKKQTKGFDLNLEVTQKIIKNAMACGEKNGWKFSVAIVNSEGNLISFCRLCPFLH